MDVFGAVLAGVGGLAFGSFLGVVVHRVPRKESIVAPRSRCPSCLHEISAADNIPVLSWLLLGGRCRHCKARIPARYPIGEALTAVIWALAVVRLDRGTDLIAFLPFLWVLVALSLIDLELKILPNRIVYPSVVAGAILLAVSAALGPGMGAWARALGGGVAGLGGFLLIALIYPAGMGMGDVKLSGLIGMYLGYLGWGQVVVGFFLSFLVGAVAGIALMIAGKAGRKSEIPFGPYLAIGAVVATLFGDPIVRAWRG